MFANFFLAMLTTRGGLSIANRVTMQVAFLPSSLVYYLMSFSFLAEFFGLTKTRKQREMRLERVPVLLPAHTL